MTKLQFSFSPGGFYEVYEVYGDGAPIGLAWRKGERWHADPHSMAAPVIRNEASRDEAGRKLQLKATS